MSTKFQPIHMTHPMIQKYITENPVDLDTPLPEWDYIQALSRSVKHSLTIPRPFAAIMKERPLLICLPDAKLFEARLLQLQTDLVAFTAEHAEIGALHAGLSGTAKDMDEKARAYQVNEYYTLLAQRASTAIEEILCHLIDMLNLAFDNYKRTHIQQGLAYRENYLNEVIAESMNTLVERRDQAATEADAGEQTYADVLAQQPLEDPVRF
jgi:hypothetical protein